MLASDAQNTEFVGAHNPDDRLFVQFYMHEPEDVNKSIETGRKVKGPPTAYVRIQVPGDKTSVIETPVRDDHKARWPQKWLYFQMQEGMIGSEADIPGWKLEDWNHINADQLRELKYMRFSVVEQIAGASDEQVQKIGMGGMTLREAARRALRDRMGAEVKEELAQKDREIQEMRERMAKLEAAIMAQAAPQPSTAIAGNAPSQEGVGQGDVARAAPRQKRKYTRKSKPEQQEEQQVSG